MCCSAAELTNMAFKARRNMVSEDKVTRLVSKEEEKCPGSILDLVKMIKASQQTLQTTDWSE